MEATGLRQKLVVVDDDEHVRRALARVLRVHGHEVRTFGCAETYLASQCEADCAILDVELPGIIGLELEARLRERGDSMPIVFITAHREAATLAAIHATLCPFMIKPVDEEDLLAAIAIATVAQA
ncbi:MAG TPA: response regulator [Vicinamibacterales bacterium]